MGFSKYAIIVSLFLCGAAAQAADPAQPVRITITKVDCSRLINHTPSPDVAYKPGEGVNGKKVAPADLPGSGAAAMPDLLPNVLEIPLTAKPLSGKGYVNNGVGDSTMALGTVKFDMGKNTFTYNGQPLGQQDQQELAEACRRQGVR